MNDKILLKNIFVVADTSDLSINLHISTINKLKMNKCCCVVCHVLVAGHVKVTCGFLALAAVDVGEVVVAALRLTHTALGGQVTPREHAGRVGWSHILLPVSFQVLVPSTL